MNALVLHGDYDLRYEAFPEPLMKPGHVKVHVAACGVCGSDIPRITQNKAHYYPIVLGHEFSGIVDEVGDGVTGLQKGDHVVTVPLIPCMKCPDCLKGNYSQCKHYSFIGSRVPGGFAEYVVLPAANVVKIDREIPLNYAALFEPATVALHGLRLSNYQGGKRVAVLGGGTIGLFALQWAKIFGAASVVVFGRDKQHLKVAKRLGADAVISTLDEDFMDRAMEHTDGEGFDYVFETAGSATTMKLCFQLAANHASICMIGTPTGDVAFTWKEWEQMNRKEFTLTGSWMSGNAPFPGDEWTLTNHCFSSGLLQYDEGFFHSKIPFTHPEKVIEQLRDRSKIKGRILLINDTQQ